MLSVQNLRYSYPNGKEVLHGITFEVGAGKILGVLGMNGAGKTTMLSCIEGLYSDYQGSIKLLGYEAKERNPQMISQIGALFQSTRLFKRMTLGEIINVFGALHNLVLSPADIDQILDTCRLLEFKKSFSSKLSGGQRQRLNLALCLLHNPKILFLDEPTTGLDVYSRQDLWEVIRNVRDAGTTVVVTSHYIQEVEDLCDQVLIIDKGNKVCDDTVENLLKSFTYSQRISFNYVLSEIDLDSLYQNLPDCKIVVNNSICYVFTPSLRQTLEDLHRITHKEPEQFARMIIQNVNLEDIFISITGKEFGNG